MFGGYIQGAWWQWWQRQKKTSTYGFVYDWEVDALAQIDPSLLPTICVIPQSGYVHPERLVHLGI